MLVREQSIWLELLNRIQYQSTWLQVGGYNLGGTSGSEGGVGTPPSGITGQLVQTKVAGDTTESFNYTSGSISSLLNNLNNLRAFVKPATWFLPHETNPVSQSVTIMPGIWHYGSGSYYASSETTYTFVPPATDNRIDLLYVHDSGVFDVIRGASAIVPTAPSIPTPTSGSMPIAYVYLRSSGSALHGWDKGENYIYQDVRPFLDWGMGGTSMVFDTANPQAVAASPVVGTSGSTSHSDHVHQGVTDVVVSGGTYASGHIEFFAGANITLSQTSGSITITSSGSGGSGGGATIYNSAYASPPVAINGDMWLIDDGYGLSGYRSGGSWKYFYKSRSVTLPPAATDVGWSWFNQGVSTITDRGILKIVGSSADAGDNLRGMVRSVTAPYTLVASAEGFWPPGKTAGFGICARQSSDGKLKVIYHQTNNGNSITLEKWNSPTSYNSTIASTGTIQQLLWPAIYYRIADDNANFTIDISPDGESDTWWNLWSEARTTFATCDQVGFFTYSSASGYSPVIYLIHWVVT